jgi:hypothetical protein
MFEKYCNYVVQLVNKKWDFSKIHAEDEKMMLQNLHEFFFLQPEGYVTFFTLYYVVPSFRQKQDQLQKIHNRCKGLSQLFAAYENITDFLIHKHSKKSKYLYRTIDCILALQRSLHHSKFTINPHIRSIIHDLQKLMDQEKKASRAWKYNTGIDTIQDAMNHMKKTEIFSCPKCHPELSKWLKNKNKEVASSEDIIKSAERLRDEIYQVISTIGHTNWKNYKNNKLLHEQN